MHGLRGETRSPHVERLAGARESKKCIPCHRAAPRRGAERAPMVAVFIPIITCETAAG